MRHFHTIFSKTVRCVTPLIAPLHRGSCAPTMQPNRTLPEGLDQTGAGALAVDRAQVSNMLIPMNQ